MYLDVKHLRQNRTSAVGSAAESAANTSAKQPPESWYPVVEQGEGGKFYVTDFLLREELGRDYVLADLHAGQLANVGCGCTVAVRSSARS